MRRLAYALGLLSVSLSLFAVSPSADQELQVTALPEPVVPGNNLVYTVVVTNHGPDPAVNGGMNGSLALPLGAATFSAPAGFTCAALGSNISCTTPSFASGATATITVTAQVSPSLIAFADGSFGSVFAPSGTTADPNPGNNTKTVTTNYNSPDTNIGVTATDAPDPVTPFNNVTYTVHVTNPGPDPATNAILNVVYNGGTFLYVSRTLPAGWSCGAATVGQPPSFSCTNPTLAAGTDDVFTVVVKADPASLGNGDRASVLQNFTVSADTHDTDNGNNVASVSTAYNAPDVDMEVTATDSPDPVYPNGNVTYTIHVVNNGPDPTTNALMSVVNSSLRFQSISAPAGWTCTPPSVGSFPSFNCSAPTVGVGSTATFTLVAKADPALFGPFPTTIQTIFLVSSDWHETNNGNSSVNVQTTYQPATSDLSVTASGTPPSVPVGGTITYTGTLGNAGPDAAPNTHFNVLLDAGLLYQSITPPPGFSCTTPTAGTNGSIDCSNASFAAAGSAAYTIGVQVSPTLLNTPGGSFDQLFVISADDSDAQQANNTAHVVTTYTTPHADLAITNSDTPDPVATGGTITYTQVLTNNGPDGAANVTVIESIGGVTFQSLATPAGFSCTTPAAGGTGTISCSAATMASGATATFTVVVNVTAAGGTITNTVATSSDNYDPTNANNSATATTTIPSADVSITKTTGTVSAPAGGTVTYTIVVSNAGPTAASGVVMTDVLPVSLLFQSISTPAGFTCTPPTVGTTGTITCNAATLASGATATFTLVVQIAPNATGTIVNAAGVTSGSPDPNPGNGTGTAGGVTVTAGPVADLSITKTTAANNVPPGGTLSYTIVVSNAGPDPASSVVMTDVLPASLLFQSISAPAGFTCTPPAVGTTGTITCNAATLASGGTATFTLTVTLAANASGSIANTATVSSATSDSNGANGSSGAPAVTVGPPQADLSVTKTTTATTAVVGSTIPYVITVTNHGPSIATNVVATDDLPAGLQFVSAVASQGTCTQSDPISCSLGTLAAGASATVTVQAKVTATSGSLTNSASATGTESDPAPANGSSSAPSLVVAPASSADVPALGGWMLLALALLLGVAAVVKMR